MSKRILSNRTLSNRSAWVLALMLLTSIAVLVACGTTYNRGSDGLVLVSSQGSALIQTFSFGLANGHIASVANSTNDTGSETCQLPGIPASIVLDPAGAYAYVILNSADTCPGSQTGIEAFQVNSDGTTKALGNITPDPHPIAMTMDSAGKFLYVAEGGGLPLNIPPIPAGINVYSISGGNLSAVSNFSNFPLTPQAPNLLALAITPMILPAGVNGVAIAPCTNEPAPTAEYLYVADSVNNGVWPFAVNTSTGALTLVTAPILPVPTDQVPAGVLVDACNRFVYVADSLTNKVSAYAICNGQITQSSQCLQVPLPAGDVVQITGSPFAMPGGANGPGPMAGDPYGNSIYVVDTLSNQVSAFRISPVSGSLAPASPAIVATGSQPKSIAIRSDDSWLFVTGFNPPALAQYAITPDTGALSAAPVTTTDNYPFGVAVK